MTGAGRWRAALLMLAGSGLSASCLAAQATPPALPPGLSFPGGQLPPPPPRRGGRDVGMSGGACLPVVDGGQLAVTIQVERGPQSGTRATLGPLEMVSRAVSWDGSTGAQFPWGHLVSPDGAEEPSEQSISALQAQGLAAMMAASDSTMALTADALSQVRVSLLSCRTSRGDPGLTIALQVPPGLRWSTWRTPVVVVRPSAGYADARALLRGQWFHRVGSTAAEPPTSGRSALTVELWMSGRD